MTNEQRAQELIRNHSLGGQTWGGLIKAIAAALDEKDQESSRMRDVLRSVSRNAQPKYGTYVVSSHVMSRVDEVIGATAARSAAESAAQRKEGEEK
jgi:hypothetical protein